MPYYSLSAVVTAFPSVSVVAAHLALSLTVAFYLKTDVQLKLRGFDQTCCGPEVSLALGSRFNVRPVVLLKFQFRQ